SAPQAVAVLFVIAADEADEGFLVVDGRAFRIGAEPVAELLMEGLIVPARAFGAERGEGGVGQLAGGGAGGEAGDAAAKQRAGGGAIGGREGSGDFGERWFRRAAPPQPLPFRGGV